MHKINLCILIKSRGFSVKEKICNPNYKPISSLKLNLLHIVFNTRLEIISKQNIPLLQNYQFYTLQKFKQ